MLACLTRSLSFQLSLRLRSSPLSGALFGGIGKTSSYFGDVCGDRHVRGCLSLLSIAEIERHPSIQKAFIRPEKREKHETRQRQQP